MKFKYYLLAGFYLLGSSKLQAQRPKTSFYSTQNYEMQRMQKIVEKGIELLEAMEAKPLSHIESSIPSFISSKADINKMLQNHEREFWEDFRKKQVTQYYQNLSEITGYPKRQRYS